MKKFVKVFYSQIFNAFFPILIVAILMKIPGQEYTAAVFLLINFANIYLLFTDYSSNITFLQNALQKGGIKPQNTDAAIIQNIHEYLGVKILLLITGLGAWIVLCLCIPLLQKQFWSNLIGYSFIVGYNLNFYWIYMSSGKEYFFIVSNFLSRLLLLCFLLLFSYLKLDFFYLMPLTGLGTMMLGTLFFSLFIKKHQIRINLSSEMFGQSILIIKRDWPLVTNNFLIMSPTTCLNVFIGFVKNTRYVIVYGFAEKIFFGVRALLSVFVNSIYPVLCKPGAISKKNATAIFCLFYLMLLTGFGVWYLISPYIVDYFKLNETETGLYYQVIFYFMLTITTISINVPLFVWLLIKNIINSHKALTSLFFATMAVVSTFLINTLYNNGIVSLVQSLWAAEAYILLAFVILYKVSRSKFTTKPIVPTMQNVTQIS